MPNDKFYPLHEKRPYAVLVCAPFVSERGWLFVTSETTLEKAKAFCEMGLAASPVAYAYVITKLVAVVHRGG